MASEKDGYAVECIDNARERTDGVMDLDLHNVKDRITEYTSNTYRHNSGFPIYSESYTLVHFALD